MSNQVYENNQNKYFASKRVSGYYLNADVTNSDVTGTDFIIPWTNTLGDSANLPFLTQLGELTCVRAGIYNISLTATVLDAASSARALSYKVLMNVENQQFVAPGLELAYEVRQGGAAVTTHSNCVCTTTAINYFNVGDILRTYVGNYGSPSTPTDQMILKGDVNGLNTNLIFTQII